MPSPSSVAMIPPCAIPPPPWYRGPNTNRTTILRFVLSCSNVSFMPPSFAPPQPKHLLVSFGSNRIVSAKRANLSLLRYVVTSLLRCFFRRCFFSSDQRYPAALRPAHTPLPLAHFHAQQLRQRGHPARDL